MQKLFICYCREHGAELLSDILKTQPKDPEHQVFDKSQETVVPPLAIELLASLPQNFIHSEVKHAMHVHLGGSEPLSIFLMQETHRVQVRIPLFWSLRRVEMIARTSFDLL